MSLKYNTPCDIENFCPYGAYTFEECEHYCGQIEPQDEPEIWEENDEEEYYDSFDEDNREEEYENNNDISEHDRLLLLIIANM